MQGVTRVPIVFVNAYLVDVEPDNPSGGWVSSTVGSLASVRRSSRARPRRDTVQDRRKPSC